MLSFPLRMGLLTHSISSIAQMRESKEVTRWPWLNQKSQCFSISAEVGSSSLDATFVMDSWCEPKSLLNYVQQNTEPVQWKWWQQQFSSIFKETAYAQTEPSTPNLSADLPVCVIKSHFKPNSNLNKIFFTHPVFSGILCWCPLSAPTDDESSHPHPTGTQQSHPVTSGVLQQEKGLRSKDLK